MFVEEPTKVEKYRNETSDVVELAVEKAKRDQLIKNAVAQFEAGVKAEQDAIKAAEKAAEEAAIADSMMVIDSYEEPSLPLMPISEPSEDVDMPEMIFDAVELEVSNPVPKKKISLKNALAEASEIPMLPTKAEYINPIPEKVSKKRKTTPVADVSRVIPVVTSKVIPVASSAARVPAIEDRLIEPPVEEKRMPLIEKIRRSQYKSVEKKLDTTAIRSLDRKKKKEAIIEEKRMPSDEVMMEGAGKARDIIKIPKRKFVLFHI